jgi:DNA-binding beta-propeller fold protein YncE
MRPIACAAALAAVAACKLGGLNTNQQQAGNRAGGIRLEDQIAVQPNGERVIARLDGALHVGTVATRHLQRIDGIADARTIAWWANGRGVFVLTRHELLSYDIAAAGIVWRRPVAALTERIDVTTDGARVIATGAEVALLDALTGATVGRFAPAQPVEDVDVTPDGTRVIVTEKELWRDGTPATTISVIAAGTGEKLCATAVPNCADQLVVHPDGATAYLAPTTCRKDPVSIIDITRDCKFEKNLPGFGPIALTPDGALGIAFLDKKANDPTAPPRPAEVDASPERFHLMTFDTRTHALRTVPIGDRMPRYALTPDGAMLVVESVDDIHPGADDHSFRLIARPLRIVDTTSLNVRTVTGPTAMLDAYVVSPDSREIWLLHRPSWRVDKAGKIAQEPHARLFRLDLGAGALEARALTIEPRSLNALPGSPALLLRDARALFLYHPETQRLAPAFSP